MKLLTSLFVVSAMSSLMAMEKGTISFCLDGNKQMVALASPVAYLFFEPKDRPNWIGTLGFNKDNKEDVLYKEALERAFVSAEKRKNPVDIFYKLEGRSYVGTITAYKGDSSEGSFSVKVQEQ